MRSCNLSKIHRWFVSRSLVKAIRLSFLCFGCPILPNYDSNHSHQYCQHTVCPGLQRTCANHSLSIHLMSVSTVRPLLSAMTLTFSTKRPVLPTTILANTEK